MNINFGMFPELNDVTTINGKKKHLKGADRKAALSSRAIKMVQRWLEEIKD